MVSTTMKIDFDHYSHGNATDSQLIVCISGSKYYIRQQLDQLIQDIDSSYGKPKQGTICHCCGGGNISIITPIWDQKRY